MKPSGIGGQAVLEGIMMKNKSQYSVAVRKPDGEIEVQVKEHEGIGGGHVWAKLPLIRGVVNFVDSLMLGMETLTFSAGFYEEEEEQEPGGLEKFLLKLFGEKAEKVVMGCTVAFSIVMAVAIFMILPYVISGFFREYIVSNTLLAIVEGGIRLGLFVLYVVLISSMKDIRRVYMYHGAEHKCINCIERGRDLNVKNVRKSSRYHARCGTSFLFIVMIISIVFFIFIRVESPVLRVLFRILLIPVIAGVSYEFIRLAGRSENPLVKLLSLPGKGMQMLTTKEPEDDMIEVAIAAVEAVFDWKTFLGYHPYEDDDEPEAEGAGMTLQELFLEGKETLYEAQIQEWELDAWYLLEYVTGMTRSRYFLDPHVLVAQKDREDYQKLLKKRAAHVPLQYLTGVQEFMGCSFLVSEQVLIPRQDTEILVEEAAARLCPGMEILDLCTGSGCILLSLLKLVKGVKGTGTDLSSGALCVAAKNKERLGVQAEFLQSDLFEQVKGRYDCILSNPPYIPSGTIDSLMEEVRDHEPRMALDGREDGLYYYREIISKSPGYLKPEGMLFLEIGYDQAEAVTKMMEPDFKDVRVKKDLAGLDRVVYGCLK